MSAKPKPLREIEVSGVHRMLDRALQKVDEGTIHGLNTLTSKLKVVRENAKEVREIKVPVPEHQ